MVGAVISESQTLARLGGKWYLFKEGELGMRLSSGALAEKPCIAETANRPRDWEAENKGVWPWLPVVLTPGALDFLGFDCWCCLWQVKKLGVGEKASLVTASRAQGLKQE